MPFIIFVFMLASLAATIAKLVLSYRRRREANADWLLPIVSSAICLYLFIVSGLSALGIIPFMPNAGYLIMSGVIALLINLILQIVVEVT